MVPNFVIRLNKKPENADVTCTVRSVNVAVLPTRAVILRTAPHFSFRLNKEHENADMTSNESPLYVGKCSGFTELSIHHTFPFGYKKKT